jgi:hypothetical protein
MKRNLILGLALLAMCAQATALIGRSGVVLKPLQLFGWVNAGYSRTVKAYDWESGEYSTAGVIPQDNLTAEVMASLGLPGKLDVAAMVPLAMKKKDTLQSSGIGDAMIIARYGVLQSSLLPIKAALMLGVNVPTATKDASPALGDRTFDIGAGLALNTSKLGPLVFQARGAYWYNGKPEGGARPGNTLEYLLDVDYYASAKVIPELALCGSMQAATDAAHEVSQHTASLLVLFKPVPFLVVRPKVSLPIASISKGGSLANFGAGLDFWVTVP